MERTTTDLRWSGGVDYIRLTFTDTKLAAYAYERYAEYAAELGRAYTGRAVVEPWGWQGYKGGKVGKASFGLRDDGAILQVSGGWASTPDFDDLPQTGIPRIDVQVTVWGIDNHSQEPARCAELTDAARKGVPSRPWKVRLENTHGDGDTLYVGSRQSDSFIRIYDKSKESKDEMYEGAVRFEVQFSNEAARIAYKSLSRASFSPHRCAQIVAGSMANRGLGLPEWVSVEEPVLCQVRKEASDLDTKLLWLRTQVAPTVETLLASGVTYDAVFGALFGRASVSGLLDKSDNGC